MPKSDCHLILGGEFDHKRACNHWESKILYQFFGFARVYLYLYKDVTTLLWFRVLYTSLNMSPAYNFKVFTKILQHYYGSA